MNDAEFLEVVRLLAEGRYLPTKAMAQRFVDKADALVTMCETRGATLDNIGKAIAECQHPCSYCDGTGCADEHRTGERGYHDKEGNPARLSTNESYGPGQ